MRTIRFEDNQFHSTYSDGSFSPKEIFEYNQFHHRLDLTITDHVDKNTDWFGRYVEDIQELRKNYPDFSIKIGCEVKIVDERGELNTTDEILKQAEVVTGTVHHFPGIKSLGLEALIEQEFILTKLLAENKKIDVLGHPFSMVKRFYKADVPEAYVREVYERCVKNGIKLEYNQKNCPASVRKLVVSEIAKGNIKNFSFGSDMHHDLSELGNSAFDVADPVTVLVTGAGAGVGQSIIKALKLSAIKTRIIATDAQEKAAGLYRAHAAYLVPRCDDSGYTARLVAICNRENVDLLFPGTDVELPVLARERTAIESETRARVIVSDEPTIQLADDKWETVQFLKKNQFPYPKTWLAGDVNQALETIALPVVVKPRHGARSIGFHVVQTTAELQEQLAAMPDAVVQEYLADDDSEHTCGAFFWDKKCYGVVTAQRWLRSGDTYKARFYHDQKLASFIEQVGAKLGLHGPCNFQLRQTASGPVIFEINCRFSGTTGAASYLGFNVPSALIERLVFNRPLKPLGFRESFMLRYLNEVLVEPDAMERLRADESLTEVNGQVNTF